MQILQLTFFEIRIVEMKKMWGEALNKVFKEFREQTNLPSLEE